MISCFVKIFITVFTFSLLLSFKVLSKPNVLFILIDDMGWMDLGCQGNKNLRTPNIDNLAKGGMRFTDAYAPAPVCSPTRAAIITGQSPARLQITNHLPHQDRFTPKDSKLLPAKMLNHLSLESETLAERLKKDAHYATAFIGKWHLYTGRDKKYNPLNQGFDINIGGCSYGGPPTFFDPYRIDFLPDRKEGEYLPNRLADEAIAFISEQNSKDKPFFVALWNYTVHWPMEAPDKLVEKYKNLPVKGYRDHRYAAMIEAMDIAIGKVLKSLDDLNITEETLVIFTSDNGPFGGVGDASPLRADKGHLYEGGIRVPLIVRWPGKVEAGAVEETPVILTDLHPTILSATGLDFNSTIPNDGHNLLPLLKGKEKLKNRAVYWHYPNFAFHRDNRLGSAIREGDHKLIHFYDTDSVELYNLKSDIGEKNDLSGKMPQLASRLKNKLKVWLQDSGAVMPTKR
ncbi:MAG: N-acetylgalactosamine-6-sulfatase [Verrucomicrobiaceae bacterium]|nr:N-acetylgalactosamine-6-sulfatase [Verrucomicrobiaceae bacterium]